ncbi:MAG: restriction endonuclease subunit R, partial [Deltaproteobacteria bacterium]|nr:restriction endonuclease subunit R [Deltaproteobacteria bacterium]
KSHFTVVDCFGGTLLEYFRASNDMTEVPPDKPSKSIADVIEDIWQNRDREYNIRSLVKRLQRIDKEMSGDARELFAAYVPDGDLGGYAKNLPGRLKADFTAAMKLLRDGAFQKLLRDYPRATRQFFSAEQQVDTVTSEWVVRGSDGREYKPEDYLSAFERYVRENPDHVDAIRILVDSPRDWSMKALEELRTRLRVTDPPFNEDFLRRAHHLRYDKALVDIISMVKHAATATSPLLTAPERIQQAFAELTADRPLTAAQTAWLSRIQGHLVENLSLSRDDFDLMPAFADFGGWGAANEVFGGTLPDWIARINEAVAA